MQKPSARMASRSVGLTLKKEDPGLPLIVAQALPGNFEGEARRHPVIECEQQSSEDIDVEDRDQPTGTPFWIRIVFSVLIGFVAALFFSPDFLSFLPIFVGFIFGLLWILHRLDMYEARRKQRHHDLALVQPPFSISAPVVQEIDSPVLNNAIVNSVVETPRCSALSYEQQPMAHIGYMDKHGAMTHRKIAVCFASDEYMNAYCFEKQAMRSFKKSRVSMVSLLSGERVAIDLFWQNIRCHPNVQSLDDQRRIFLKEIVIPGCRILTYLANKDAGLEEHWFEVSDFIESTTSRSAVFLRERDIDEIEEMCLSGVSLECFKTSLQEVHRWPDVQKEYLKNSIRSLMDDFSEKFSVADSDRKNLESLSLL